jgi:hypothetical protein
MGKKNSHSSQTIEIPVKQRRNWKKKAVQAGEGETRATFIVDEGLLNKVRAVAYWERKQLKTVLHEALSSLIKDRGTAYVEQALAEREKNVR